MRPPATAAVLLLLVMHALSSAAWAQTGKLSGTVTDAETGEPIPGATVLLENTTLGTATDEQGRYVVIGISPSTYSVRFSFVGYSTQVVEDVQITSDRTTTLDAELQAEVLEGDEVVVEAQRPVVDASQTTSRSLVTQEEIARLPVTTLQDVISRTANNFEGFIRGSRRIETKTVIEGIDVTDALYALTPNASKGQTYAGLVYNNTNKADQTNVGIFTLNPEAVSEVTVNTGATDARYATGAGGIINVVMDEGRGPIRGSVSARMAPQINVPGPDSLAFYPAEEVEAYQSLRTQLLSDPATEAKGRLFNWEPDRYAFSDDPEMDFRFSLGGSLTDAWTFMASGQWFQTNGFQPNQFDKRIGGTLKSSYNVSEASRITALAIVEDRGLWGDWNNRSYHDYWRYYLEGVAQDDGGSYLGSLQWTQVLSENSFLSVQAYRTHTRTRYGYVDDDGNGFTDPGEDGDFLDFTDPDVIETYIGAGEQGKMFSTNISNAFGDITGMTAPDGTRLRTAQPQPYFEDAANASNGLRVDYSNQVTFNHFIQAGIEAKLRQFDYEEVYGIDQPGSKLNSESVEPYRYTEWSRNPWELSLYGSDRMEYGGLIVNLGLRLDLIDRDMQEIEDYYYPFVRDTIEVNGRRLARNTFRRGDDVPIDVFLNPRIGVSHPIGSSAAMYFSYARNQQIVYALLYDFYGGNNSNTSFTNYPHPNQEPISSNNYELGVQWEFAEGWGADINAYMRAIDNYDQIQFAAEHRVPEGEQTVSGYPSGPHRWMTSYGYADSRGVELVLRRRPLQLAQDVLLGVTASYTYSSVEAARNAVGVIAVSDNDPENPTTEVPFELAENTAHFPQNVRGGSSTLTAGYDRRHRGIVRAVSSLPFDFSVGLTGAIESGFLYPRQIDVDPRDRELLTGPTNFQLDLRLEKRFDFGNRIGADVYADIINLTNRLNVVAYNNNPQSIELEIFERTGNPGSRLIQRDGTALYGPARNVYFGARVRF